jgi:hypothetical protein
MAFLLQWVFGCGFAFHLYRFRGNLKRLLCSVCYLKCPCDNQSRADILLNNLLKVLQTAFLKHNLHTFKRASVVKVNKAVCFHITNRPHPAAHGDFLVRIIFLIMMQLFNSNVHIPNAFLVIVNCQLLLPCPL